ncbi:MAG TPA: 8-amino-7-oxononanoate synthase [bacterium]|nr:8-amino-7-oxononanoate synthase [bacterium]
MLTSLLQEELEVLKARDLYRKLRSLRMTCATRAEFEGRELLLFCGNDYLGLSHHPRVIEAAKKACEEYGVGAGAARLISGTSELHTRLEESLASFKGKEKALIFTAGYLANLGILSTLAGEGDLVVMDKLCHASLIDGARLSGAHLRVFPHKNYEKCEEIFQKSPGFRKRFLVSDTVFSMDGDLADLQALVRIKERYEAFLLVDDAHGTGVLGLEGKGAAEDLKIEEKIDCVAGTLSKALGCVGGFAAASPETIDYLINFSRPFIFATALPPAICQAALTALEVLRTEPEIRHRLWQNIQKMHEGLLASGFASGPIGSPIFPVMIGPEKEALRLSDALFELGLLVPAVRYPTVPKGKARLRVTVSASHSEQDIRKLIRALETCQKP